jgi:2,3-bisphosphoglycerate-independent phosphoglycerate mutase
MPESFDPSRDVATLSLLGYDPRAHHRGRAAFDAAAAGLSLGPTDRVSRLDLVHVGPPGTLAADRLIDASPALLTDTESATLLAELLAGWRTARPHLAEDFTLHPLAGPRSLLIRRASDAGPGAITTPPYFMLDEPWRDNLPGGPGFEAQALRDLALFAAEFLPSHEANLARADQGLRTANLAWPWGAASAISLPAFGDRHGLRGVCFSGVDVDAALATLIGWDARPAPPAARDALDALRTHDLVCLRLDAPDAAAHRGDVAGKIAAIEHADAAFVGPILDHFLADTWHPGPLTRAPAAGEWRLLVTTGHATPCDLRRPSPEAVPFAMAGTGVRSLVPRPFTESAAADSDLHVDPGHDLMEYFLWSGRRRPRSR